MQVTPPQPSVPSTAPGPVAASPVQATAPAATAQTSVPAAPVAAEPKPAAPQHAPGTPSMFAPILVDDSSSFPVSQPHRPVSDVRRWMAPGSYWTSAEAPLTDTVPDDVEAACFRQNAVYLKLQTQKPMMKSCYVNYQERRYLRSDLN